MAFCTKCGTKIVEGRKFCTGCGRPLQAPAQTPAPEKAPEQTPAPEQTSVAVPTPGVQANGRTLLKVFQIPESVRKQYAKYLTLELYTDRLIGKGGGNGDITYFFKNYMGVTWTPASLATQFAQIVFLTHENSGNYINGSNLTNIVDMNKIPFCSGMFSYEEANAYTKALYMEIKAALDNFKEQESNASTAPVVQQVSAADELLKFKQLLDMGAITQEEFDAKKKQLLGL